MSRTTDELNMDRQDSETTVDVAELESLGRDVVSAMQSLRELLEARANVLESCRAALEEHSGHLTDQREALVRQEAELCEQY